MNHAVVVRGIVKRLKKLVVLADYHVRVTWSDDTVEIKDLAPLLLNHRSFMRVRSEVELFNSLRISDDGERVVWPDGTSLTARSIEKLPRSMMTSDEFRSIMTDLHLTGDALGRLLGLSRRAITGYRGGEPVPKSVALAMRHISQLWDA